MKWLCKVFGHKWHDLNVADYEGRLVRLCLRCKLEEVFIAPPVHHNCRCVLEPIKEETADDILREIVRAVQVSSTVPIDKAKRYLERKGE